MFRLLAKANELERKGQNIIHFEIGDPHFDSPGHVVQAAAESLSRGDTHYVTSMGIAELREAICTATEKELGFRPALSQVLIIPANAVIYFVIRCVVNPGEEVIVPDPGFPTYWSALRFIGAKPVRVQLDEQNSFQLDPDELRRKITPRTRLIIVNSPHNPTGSVLTEDRLKEVARLAEVNDIFLLTDEVYRKISYDETPLYSPSQWDGCRERTVMLNSLSKSHAMSGWRLGYAIGPEAVIEKMNLLVQTIMSCLPSFIQYGGVKAFDHESDHHVMRMVGELRARRNLLVRGLNELPGISCELPGGAFYAFPNIRRTGLSANQFADYMLEEAGVALLPGTNFGRYGQGHVRLSYSVSSHVIQEGLERMKLALEKTLRLQAFTKGELLRVG